MASKTVETFLSLLEKEHSLLLEDLSSPALGFLASAILPLRPILLVTSHDNDTLFEDLRFFAKEKVLDFPSWETLPGEEIPPSLDLVGKRLDVLERLRHEKRPLVIASLQACLQKIPTPESLFPKCLQWKIGSEVLFDDLSTLLTESGYKAAPVVSDKGEFALRCGILDLFPLSSSDPYRIEFFGDTISDIRTFDPMSQKSTGKVSSVTIPPGSETTLFSEFGTLLDYFQEKPLVIFQEILKLEDRAVALSQMPGSKSPLFLSPSILLDKLLELPHLFLSSHRIETLSEVVSSSNHLRFELWGKTLDAFRWRHPFQSLTDFFSPQILEGIKDHPEIQEISFICTSEADKNTLSSSLKTLDLFFPDSAFSLGYLSSGFVIPEEKKALIPITELSKRAIPRRQKWRTTHHTPPSEFHELSIGDPVVHFHHGIGKYLGLEKKKNHLGQEDEFLKLEYDAKSILYVPASQAYLVSRYIGADEQAPRLSTLGSSKWQNLKAKTQQAIIGYAHDLIQHEAQRSVTLKTPCPTDSEMMRLFEQDFPFVETDDQQRAILALKEDLMSEKPMDRLICGDVGYGKTEVAMRAAFKTVACGEGQVAVLVPTTVLALQHYESFKARMANFPVRIGLISRFSKPKEVKKILEQIALGELDILIGTHRLLSEDVHFKKLSLLIIDEEQRFGVRAKEALKKRKVGVDCLTLSATPIPRTLYLSLIGIRSISVIHTPPQDRLPIKSIVAERENSLIQNALLRELSRKGQAFFIHNRVESIFHIASELQKLVPQAKIGVGHGQMSSEELDTVFHSFKSGLTDILVATTIVENGIDIPNANTILIDRADTFGLADLYQMRGRVGRWNRPAYAYFLIPQHRVLNEISDQRLKALLIASGHGGGMKIAMRDLEIRGAGDILGVQQSGHVAAIGFHLYCRLLTKAITALKNKKQIQFTETKMEFSYPASLPESYISDPSVRMEIYHRLGDAENEKDLQELWNELLDRFGKPPLETRYLYHLTRLKVLAAVYHFTLIKIETYTLTAERVTGKHSEKKILPLPKTKKPEDLGNEILQLLKTSFKL